jgi:ABC-type uncharacterized transport system substrate-binding protein
VKRREFLQSAIALSTGAAFSARAQAKVWRIGFLGVGTSQAYAYRIDALKAGLRELGYVEGKNVAFEYRWAEGNVDRLPALASELVRAKVDVLVTHTGLGVRAARNATASIPIIMTDGPDPVAMGGLAQSLARPGGNVTGSTLLLGPVNAKRLTLLKEALPRLRRVALLVNPAGAVPIHEEMKEVSRSLNVELAIFEARTPADFEPVFASMRNRGADAAMVLENPLFTVNTKKLADLARKERLPLVGFTEFATAGGLIGYGIDFVALYHHAAYFVDRILKGAKPGDLPIEQPTRFEMIINMKTAKALGIEMPTAILVRADKVIE